MTDDGKIKSDGGSTSYYRLPEGATELNDLIEHKAMSFALGNIFKACYRLGEKDGASALYDVNKIIYFAERIRNRLEAAAEAAGAPYDSSDCGCTGEVPSAHQWAPETLLCNWLGGK